MEGSEQLLTIAEIGAAYAGFTAVVGVLTASNRRHRTRLGFWIMFEFALATIFFSLLPFIFFNFGAEAITVWSLSSLTMAVFFIMHIFIVGRRHILPAVARGEYMKQAPYIFGPILFVTGIVQLLNTFGIFFERSYAAYFLGLVLFLVMASVSFVGLLIDIWATDD